MLALTSPVETVWHRLPAGAKMAVLPVLTLGLFHIEDPWLMAVAAALALAAYLPGGRIFLLTGIRMLRPLWVFAVIVLAWHSYKGAPQTGALITLRLVATVAAANLVTMTTRLDHMVDVLMWVLTPLRRLGLRTAPLGFAIALVIRFTPVLFEKGRMLIDAWRSRSARKPGWQVLVPITVIAIQDAERVAEALRARGGIENDR